MFQPRITLLLLLAVFSSFCQQAPANSTKQYMLGTTYSYQYTASVLLNEPPPLFSQNSAKTKGTDVGYQVAATVELTPLWQNPSEPTHVLLELVLKNPKLSIRSRKAQQPDGFVDHSSPLDDIENSASVYLDWNDGRISHFYFFEPESPALVNFKKGIASLFQVQSTNVEASEIDASGSCTAVYKILGERTVMKSKNNCHFQRSISSFARPQKLLGVSSVSSHQTKFDCKSDSKIVDVLTSTEVHSLRARLRSQAGASVISRQYLRLNSEAKSSKTYSGSTLAEAVKKIRSDNNVKLVEDDLQIVEEPANCESPCKTLKEAVNEVKEGLQTSQLATISGASAFVNLIPVFRRSSKAHILALLKSSKNKNILPQLLDVVAATQTAESFAAAKEVLNFQSQKDSDIALAERFLQVVSLSTHPDQYLLEGLVSLISKIESRQLSESALLSLAAVTKAFASEPGKSSHKLVEDIHALFLQNLEACPNEDCTQMYMRVLKNLRSKKTLPVILKYVDNKDKKTSVGAIKALRALVAFSSLDNEVKQKLQRVYFQLGRSYDSSARSLALDTLLEHQPESGFLLDLLNSISQSDKASTEINTYTLQRLQESAGNDPAIRAQLKQILADHFILNNYHVFAQNGMSTAFSRDLYRSTNGNGAFSSSTEAAGGMMKRSAFDVYLRNEDTFQLLSFGLFTGGLNSLMGSSNDDGEEEEATAGMEISLAGVQLRPFVFFTGQGELMGHVWSGTASERTSALQATVLLQDHRQVIPLQSGFIAVLDVRGSVSFDFGGEIQISIWNRNSHSVVDDSAAWELDGSLNIVTPFVKSSVDFTVAAQAKIDFTTDVNFGDGLLACLRMGQEEFKIDYTVQKRESIPGTKHWIHKRKKLQDVVPGRTYALNDKNSALCNEMFPKEF